MQDAKITVIVSVYKVEQYLDRCMDSILHQTYQNLEIILVDDGSPDNCGELCDQYVAVDSRVKVLHQENGGYYYYRNNENSSTFRIDDKFYVDAFDALEDEILYMKEKHMELVDYPRKTYMYWLLDYYRTLRKSKNVSKAKLRDLHKKYRQLYKAGKGLKKERFYTMFYFAPEMYLKWNGNMR